MADVLGDVVPDPFPARSKSVLADVGGLKTHLTVMHFADKILVTIAQNGRLPIWINVPLTLPTTDPTARESFTYTDDYTGLEGQTMDDLPIPHLTASTLLGGGSEERSNIGQLLATKIASKIVTKAPGEGRQLVVGLGLEREKVTKEEFSQLLGLVEGVI